jgi:hypothetical protein
VQHVGPTGWSCRFHCPKSKRTPGTVPGPERQPYIYDAIVQCLLIWSQEFYQAPCLPSRLDQFIQYRPIPFEETVHVTMKVAAQSETSVIGDITVQDAEGRVYVRINGLEGTISRQLKRFIGAHTGSQVAAY